MGLLRSHSRWRWPCTRRHQGMLPQTAWSARRGRFCRSRKILKLRNFGKRLKHRLRRSPNTWLVPLRPTLRQRHSALANGRPLTKYGTIDAAGKAMTYTDDNVEEGVEYRYRVAAVNDRLRGGQEVQLAGESSRYRRTLAARGLAYSEMDRNHAPGGGVTTTSIIALDPDNEGRFSFERARAYFGLGEPGRAVEDYDNALRLAPGDAVAHGTTGGTCHAQLTATSTGAISDFDAGRPPGTRQRRLLSTTEGLTYAEMGKSPCWRSRGPEPGHRAGCPATRPSPTTYRGGWYTATSGRAGAGHPRLGRRHRAGRELRPLVGPNASVGICR